MGKHLAEPDEDQPKAPIWRSSVAISAVLMLAIIIGTILVFRWLTSDQSASQDSTLAVDNTETDPFEASPEDSDTQESNVGQTSIVHIVGEVSQPGIVELEEDARVTDAIEAAGGPTEQAQLDALNLAAVINDGDYILVPNQDDAGDVSQEAPGTGSPGPDSGGAGSDSTVNINTAETAELETLPSIGPATAEQIISHREQHGAFGDLSELEAVSGIGPATRERLDGLVSW